MFVGDFDMPGHFAADRSDIRAEQNRLIRSRRGFDAALISDTSCRRLARQQRRKRVERGESEAGGGMLWSAVKAGSRPKMPAVILPFCIRRVRHGQDAGATMTWYHI